MPNSRPKRALPPTPGKFVARGTGPDHPNHPHPVSLCSTTAGGGCLTAQPVQRPKPRDETPKKPLGDCENMAEKEDSEG